MNSGEPREVVVVGAGVAGLTAALSLAEAGLRPLVLEADPARVGGRFGAREGVRFEHRGREWTFPGEHGVHGIWSHYRNLRGLLARHGLLDRLRPGGRQEWVYSADGRLGRIEVGSRLSRAPLPAPFHYLWLLSDPGFLRMFGPLDLVRLPWVGFGLLSLLPLDPLRDGARLHGRTVSDLLFGWPLRFQAFAAALARSGLATGADAPLAGFIALFRFYSLLRRDSIRYDYLDTDPEEAVMAPLAAALRQAAGELVLGARVRELEREGDGWLVVWEGRSGAGEGPAAGSGYGSDITGRTAERDAPGRPSFGSAQGRRWAAPTAAGSGVARVRHVVLATDAAGAQRLLRAGRSTAAGAARLRWPQPQATAVARLWFERAPAPRAEAGMLGGDFVLDNFFWLHRIQRPFRAWHEQTGGSAVEAHIYGPPALLAEPDETLLSMAAWDTGRAFPEVRGSLLHAHLQRNPATHTLFDIGTTGEHLGIETPWPGLFCCGDWVRAPTPSLFLERACTTGLLAANRVRAACGLPELAVETHPGPEPLARALEVALRGTRMVLEGLARLGGVG